MIDRKKICKVAFYKWLIPITIKTTYRFQKAGVKITRKV